MTPDMNVNRSAIEVLKKPIATNGDNGVYLWIIVCCSLGGAVLLTLLITALIYLRRRKKKGADLHEGSYIPGAEFCPQQMISSYSSSTSDDLSEGTGPGRNFLRPLGPSASLDTPSLLRLSSECVQPRPTLTRWHTLATPHTTAVLSTLETDDRDSDEEEPHNPPCLHGRLWFSVSYQPDSSRLEVTLHKAKYLPGRGLSNGPRDPFVKVFLLPDEETFRQTRIRKRTLAPKFEETFFFEVAADDLPKRTLKLSVYDVDKRKVRHCLGHVLYPLSEPPVKGRLWKDLEMAPQSSESPGELQVCLSCNPFSNRIKATVSKLRNLKTSGADEQAVLYVKVQLFHGRKLIKSKRTVPQPLSSDPSFDETFGFGVSGRFFDSCSLCFTVMVGGPSPLVRDRALGCTVVGPFMYARGEALLHWQEMLANPRNSVTRWHALENVKKA